MMRRTWEQAIGIVQGGLVLGTSVDLLKTVCAVPKQHTAVLMRSEQGHQVPRTAPLPQWTGAAQDDVQRRSQTERGGARASAPPPPPNARQRRARLVRDLFHAGSSNGHGFCVHRGALSRVRQGRAVAAQRPESASVKVGPADIKSRAGPNAHRSTR